MTPDEAGAAAYRLVSCERVSVGHNSTSTEGDGDNVGTLDSIGHGLHMDSILAHAGLPLESTSKIGGDVLMMNVAMSPPLHMSTTYGRCPDGSYGEGASIYGRCDNPTRLMLERVMFELETNGLSDIDFRGQSVGSTEQSSNGRDSGFDKSNSSLSPSSFAFSSGMMAASSIILAHNSPVHVILPDDLYHGVKSVLSSVFRRFHVTTEQVDLAAAGSKDGLERWDTLDEDHDNPLQKALWSAPQVANSSNGGDIIVWIETPSNPLCHVTDIQSICRTVAQFKAKVSTEMSANISVTVVVDSTLAPPVVTQPLKFGADVVLHSATKYLGGHSDALCGIVTASPFTDVGRLLAKRLKEVQVGVGGIASAMDSWLVLRGLRTLQCRVERQCRTAHRIASYLHLHPSVYRVYYPGIPNSNYPRQCHIARQQMNIISLPTITSNAPTQTSCLFGGVLSLEMDCETKAYALAGAVQLIHRATSLGGTETLIEHRYSIEPDHHKSSPKGLLRLSVGLEHCDDLIADLEQALRIVDKLHPCKVDEHHVSSITRLPDHESSSM